MRYTVAMFLIILVFVFCQGCGDDDDKPDLETLAEEVDSIQEQIDEVREEIDRAKTDKGTPVVEQEPFDPRFEEEPPPPVEPEPVFVADGKIAFAGAKDGMTGIYTINPDGTNLTRLTGNPHDQSPAWSWDRRSIAFTSARHEPHAIDIYVFSRDNGREVRLTGGGDTHEYPSWSPDGKRLVFSMIGMVHVMHLDGGGLVRLTDDQSQNLQPDWSPDGKHIVLTSFIKGVFNIVRINADGTGWKLLTDNPADDEYPDWSPVSGQIAFMSYRDGSWGIFVVHKDGGPSHRLTDPQLDVRHPSWSPDGAQIAVELYRDGIPNIAVMNGGGGDLVNITDSPFSETDPAWH